MDQEHPVFGVLGRWRRHFGTPVWALVAQGCLGLAIVVIAGSFIDTILHTAPVLWVFFLATGLSVFVLRHKEPQTLRPYKVTGHAHALLKESVKPVAMLSGPFKSPELV